MDTGFIEAFVDNTSKTIMDMAGIKLIPEEELYKETGSIDSFGISSIVSFAGKVKGRLLLDMEESLAIQITKNVLKESVDNPREDMILSTIGELNNIISGTSVTNINDTFSMDLRLSPPVVFTGDSVVIAIPKIDSISNSYTTEYGKMKINIAIEGGKF